MEEKLAHQEINNKGLWPLGGEREEGWGGGGAWVRQGDESVCETMPLGDQEGL